MTGAAILTEKIILQRKTIDRNQLGEGVETWGTLATRMAQVADVSAAESFRAQEVGAQLTTRFTIRYSSQVATLNPTDRLTFGSTVFQITGVRAKERNRWLEIDAVARNDLPAQETGSP